MILLATSNRLGAEELFEKQQARDRVRPCHFSKREFCVRVLRERFIQAPRTADEKDKRSATLGPRLDLLRKSEGVIFLPVFIKRNHECVRRGTARRAPTKRFGLGPFSACRIRLAGAAVPLGNLEDFGFGIRLKPCEKGGLGFALPGLGESPDGADLDAFHILIFR